MTTTNKTVFVLRVGTKVNLDPRYRKSFVKQIHVHLVPVGRYTGIIICAVRQWDFIKSQSPSIIMNKMGGPHGSFSTFPLPF